MAKLEQAFDSGQYEDMQSGFDPMPAGVYKAIVFESSLEKVKAPKTGKYIKLKSKIIEGEFKGRFVWTNLNIVNPNPVAVEIAQKELATLCRACGKGVIQDTAVLHGIPINMKIKIKPAKGDFPAGNEPVGYTSLSAISQGDAAALENTGEKKKLPSDDEIPWDKEE